MRELKERILKDGQALNEAVLKVDSFINHQVDPNLMENIGKTFADKFADDGVTKVVTIESSGIAPSVFTAKAMNVKLVILKKSTSKILEDNISQTEVASYTKGTEYQLTLNKKYINRNDRVLIIDDFLARGEAAQGAIRLIEAQGAEVVGVGILIEKAFQSGNKALRDKGYTVCSLARIKNLSDGHIEFLED
ncbi:MAG: xanthine phosphoribosyltransferase [Clostridiales bacterium]|nr:xanthine phosphoribosyltransferase [Clostridiales bacterium]MDD7347802.1 xanthine phosphoribosyltransferase [Clostridiales bacterium]MDY4060009.1 xanthine phosphoribosyltransferase [Anaerovoracaceae bacterium]